jgi:pimeloyl-ACP methyl ester carboxylesterase
MSKQIIIYSHGFGVRKDDRGLFTDIAAAIPEYEHVLFDYYEVNDAANSLTLAPLQEQIEKLRQVVDDTRERYKGAVIDVVAHSQGCVIAAAARPEGVRRFVMLAPPVDLSARRLINLFRDRPGSKIDLDGVSRLPRTDGSTTIVPAAYWKSLDGPQPVQLYNRLCEIAKVTIVEAEHDEILGDQDFSAMDPRIDLESIDGDHGFTGAARAEVAEMVKRELS